MAHALSLLRVQDEGPLQALLARGRPLHRELTAQVQGGALLLLLLAGDLRVLIAPCGLAAAAQG
eukprot:12181958-Alexandrium_andersonii.AAC.1